jgi:thioredoxin 1
MKNTILYFLTVCGLMMACQESKNALTPDQFEKAISKGAVQLVDVRTEEEFKKEHIENAVNFNYNGNEFETQIENLDRTKPVYVYCLSGGRSSSAGKVLEGKGFTQVYELKGGMLAWSKAQKLVVVEKPKEEVIKGNEVEQMVAASIANDTLTMIDFFAYWCKPCMQMKPAIDKLEKELTADVEILSVDVDVQRGLASKYAIEAMPTLVFFKNGEEVNRIVGYQTEDQLRTVISKFK